MTNGPAAPADADANSYSLASIFYDPAAGHDLPYNPFKAIVAPRLIGWISSRSPSGQLNLAPYSFFGAFATYPSIIGFSSEAHKAGVSDIASNMENNMAATMASENCR